MTPDPNRDGRNELDLNDRLHRVALTGVFVLAGALCLGVIVMMLVGKFQLVSFVTASVVLAGCVWLTARVNSPGRR